MTLQIACPAGQESGDTSSGREWFRPPPPEPDPKFSILPWTASRVLLAVPPTARDLAISKLATAESVELTRTECEALGVPFEADQLLDEEIGKKQADVKRLTESLKRHPLHSSKFDKWYHDIESGIADGNTLIAHWKSLKGRIRPYLVRAVAADHAHPEFYASFWRNSVDVSHNFVIDNSANDPLHQYASMGDIAPSDMVKWPVVVYLEVRPLHVYTRISVLKLGR